MNIDADVDFPSGQLDEPLAWDPTKVYSSNCDGGWIDYLIPATDPRAEAFIMQEALSLCTVELDVPYTHDPEGTHFLLMPTNGEYIQLTPDPLFLAAYFFGLGESEL